ncbi:ParA family protein [Desulfoferrobacter suflitae]|uniref:ParA family protein n=1 Tax=Desulfoferrobacter suflitae TaxID=2865782 RepID=UPI0021646242|nr:ParA family protein [Desulfoferrobacter suflitae]MCK8603780.1 ParA family protein [Desulfoferrobacter suflitae]
MQKGGIIISISNNKGGVGKTSVTCNLAVALSRLKKRVLVVDMDHQCNASEILRMEGVPPTNTIYELLDPDSGHAGNVSEFVYPSRQSNVDCISNIEESSALDIPLAKASPQSFTILRDKIRRFCLKSYDYTLIDNPPSIGLWLTLSLYASDFALVPVDAGSGNSLDGLRRVLEMINDIRTAGNSDLKFLRLLVNRVHMRLSVSRQIVKYLQERLPADQLFDTNVPSNTAIQKAEFMKQTVFEYEPTSRAASAYRQLAKELVTITNGANTLEPADKE